MNFRECILQRRSVRKYTDENIPEDVLHRILEAGLLAPSSQNRKPCDLYVMTDTAKLEALSTAKALGAGALNGCSAAVVVAADSDKADTWIEDASIVLSYLNLAAVDEGLASCWVQMHLRADKDGTDAEQNVRALLELPSNERIVGVLALGYPARNAKPHTPEDADFSRVHFS